MPSLVILAVLFFVLTALARNGRFEGHVPERWRRAFRNPATTPTCAITIALMHLAYLWLVASAARHQIPALPWFAQLPIGIVNDADGRYHIAPVYGEGFALLAILESAALFAIFRSFDSTRTVGHWIVRACIVVMWTSSLAAPAASSADMYAYVGYAMLPASAYSPTAIPFTGAYHAINLWWGTPVVPAPYGPLWLEVSAFVTAPQHSLLAKIVALRCFDAASLALIVVALGGLGISKRTQALLALNAALLFQFIVNVHNDVFVVLVILVAELLMRRNRAIGTLVAVCAGLLKLPYVLVAAVALAPIRSLRARLCTFAFIIAATLSISWFAGGPAYIDALREHVNTYYGNQILGLIASPFFVPKLVLLLTIGLAFVANVYIDGGAWLFACLNAILYPWYLVAGVPYAAHDERILRNLLIALPLATLAADTAIGNGATIAIISYAAFIFLMGAIARRILAIRRATPAGPGLRRFSLLPWRAAADGERLAAHGEIA